MRLTALLMPPLLILGLAACGGKEDTAAPATSSAPSSVTATPSPSGMPSQDAQLIGIEAQAVGLDVAAWSVKHDFADPADDADFQKKIDYQHSLSEGEKATYRTTGSRKFETCVTKYDGSTALGWGIYESTSGGFTSGVGAPTEDFCP